MSTRSGRVRISAIESSPPRTRKGISPPRSPARKKASPPARSPSRKSPARKSPSRKTSNYPARKSPSRTTKEIIEQTKLEFPTAVASPIRRSVRTSSERKIDDKPSTLDSLRSRRSQRIEYSIQDVSVDLTHYNVNLKDKLNGLESSSHSTDKYSIKNKPVEEVAPRRSSRLRDIIDNLPDKRKSISKSASKSIETLSDEEHSEEEFQKEKSMSMTRKLVTPLRETMHKILPISVKREFGGRIGSFLLMFLLPLTVFSILVLCQKHCSLQAINYSVLKTSLYSPLAYILLLSQVMLQTIMACYPIFGKKSTLLDDTGKTYCFNAFFSTVVALLLIFGLDYLKIFDNNLILNEIIPLAVGSYIFSVIMSILLYIKSSKVEGSNLNPYGNTGFFSHDYLMGREIHPKYKKLYFKILISRICNINSLILAVLVFKHGVALSGPVQFGLDINGFGEIWSRLQFKPTVLLFSMMQLTYLLTFILTENQIVATFFWQHEGLGYLQLVASGLYPFYFITISKSVVDGQVTLSTTMLIGAAVLYLIGFTILLTSNSSKYELRKNPSFNYFKSMPTFQGKHLLLSSLWGVIRHPNYTGDILIHIALALPGVLSGRWVASVPALLTILVLIHRAYRDHIRCQRKYGAAWQRYCKKVPKVFIPKVF